MWQQNIKENLYKTGQYVTFDKKLLDNKMKRQTKNKYNKHDNNEKVSDPTIYAAQMCYQAIVTIIAVAIDHLCGFATFAIEVKFEFSFFPSQAANK